MGTRYCAALLMATAAIAGCHRDQPAPPAQPGTAPAPVAATPQRVVNVYNWADYIAPGVVAEFEKTTGIKVNYDTFASQEMLETRLLAQKSGYDVVVVASNVLERLVPIGVFRKLDYGALPGRRNLDEELMIALAKFDPGNQYAVGYLWGTTGIGYDARKVSELVPDAPTDSWRLVYDPRIVAKLAGCGVSVADAPSEVIATALMSLGRDPNQLSPEALTAARKVLLGMRPSVRKIDADSQINDLSGGSICVMVTWGSNVVLARTRATEAGQKPDFRYVIPREGTIRWIDTLAIPADAPHPDEALAFIDFLMRPEIAAQNANFVGGATVNAAALPLIDESLRTDPALYPTAEVRARLQPLHARTQDQSRDENSLWTAFQTGP